MTTRELAEKVVELYWPQADQYEGRDLVQNCVQEGAIMARVRALRGCASALPGPGVSFYVAKSRPSVPPGPST